MKSQFTIYNASAGAGKTFTLTVQYIARLLASGRESENVYRQILAVTFTNKATAEMKDRILQQLYGIGAGLKESDGYLANVRRELAEMGKAMDISDIRVGCQRALHNILHDYSRFRVETIDSFFRGIMTDMAHELGLPTGLRANIDSNKVIDEAVDRIIDRLDQNDSVRRWVTDFLLERMEEGRRWDVAREIKDFARHIFDDQYLKNKKSLTDFLCNDEEVKRLRERLRNLNEMMCAALAEHADNLEQVCGESDMSNISYAGDFAKHIAYVRKVVAGGELKDVGTRLQKYADDYASMLKKKHTPGDEAVARALNQGLRELLKAENTANAVITTVRLTQRNINPMRLLATVAREVNAIAQEHGSFLLANTPILLHLMVDGSDTPFIYEKTGAFLRHIMLDEFQDTSTLQWGNFQTLIADNMANNGSTLVVGDVKQSIYRWRGGDYSILAKLKKDMQQYAPQVQPLKTNHRSSRRVIDFNNHLYVALSDTINETKGTTKWSLKTIYQDNEIKQEVPADRAETGYVELTAYKPDKDDPTFAIERMCDKIEEMVAGGYNPNDIAILIRYRNEITPIADVFARRLPHIPLVSDDVFTLKQSSAVNILINAMRVIHHHDDRASLGRLIYLYHNHVLCDGKTLNQLFDTTETAQLLPAAFADKGRLHRMPVYELISELAEMFSLSTLQGQSAYLMAFYDSIVDTMTNDNTSLTRILDYWDTSMCDKKIPRGDVYGVNVMTIHRAKGLEWKTVFMPHTDWKLMDASHQNDNIMWCSTEGNELFDGLPCAAIPATKAAETSMFAKDYTREIQNQMVDNLNLLYVATTRAKDNLYIWGKNPQMKEESLNPSMTQIIATVIAKLPHGQVDMTDTETRYAYGSPVLKDEEKKQDRAVSQNRLDLRYENTDVDTTPHPVLMNFRQSTEALQFTGNGEHEAPTELQSRYINTGAVLHGIFSAVRSARDIHKVVGALPASMIRTDDGRDLRQYAVSLLEKGLTNSVLAELFSERYSITNECTIAERDEETGHIVEHRPDRVLSDGERTIVLDFKFGQPKEKHREQVRRYMRLIRQMHPYHKVEGLLWYVYQNELKRVE